MTFPDPYHSENEQRFINIGLSARARILVVIHTERGSIIRLISGREATKLEQKSYEEEI